MEEVEDVLFLGGVGDGGGLPVVGGGGVDVAGDERGVLLLELSVGDGEDELEDHGGVLRAGVAAETEVAQRVDDVRAFVDLCGLEDVGVVAEDEVGAGVHKAA